MKADFFTYIITRADGTISSAIGVLYNSLSQAEREAFSEFDFSKDSVVQYRIEKIEQSAHEITYGVYARDMFNRSVSHVKYIIHILPMEIAQDDWRE